MLSFCVPFLINKIPNTIIPLAIMVMVDLWPLVLYCVCNENNSAAAERIKKMPAISLNLFMFIEVKFGMLRKVIYSKRISTKLNFITQVGKKIEELFSITNQRPKTFCWHEFQSGSKNRPVIFAPKKSPII